MGKTLLRQPIIDNQPIKDSIPDKYY